MSKTLPIDIPRESPSETPLARSYQTLSSFSEASRCSSATSLSSSEASYSEQTTSVPLPKEYQRPWQEIVADKRASRSAKLPEAWLIPESCFPGPEILNVSEWCNTCGLFSREELIMTNSTACEIVENIASGHWTSMTVLQAFCHRATVAQQVLNCLTEICFDEALTQAAELDAYFIKEGKTIGPLHGLPISFKDQFDIKGVETTMAYTGWVGRVAEEDSTLVALCKKAGAIPFCKTTVPTTLMSGDTTSVLFGRTLNPINRRHTAGGSSGGDSALVAFRGSPMSIGTDIGGSIRFPACFAGLYAIRPSHGVISMQGAAASYPGLETARSCGGPLCHSASDVQLFMRSIASMQPWLYDPQVIPLPWGPPLPPATQQLCFGWSLKGDGIVQPSPPIKRALLRVKEALEVAGHCVIEYYPVEAPAASTILGKMLLSDSGENFSREIALSGEPWPVETENWIKNALVHAPPPTVMDTLAYTESRNALARSWLDRWQATAAFTGTGRPIDGLIMPAVAAPAQPFEETIPYSYTALSVLLDLSTACFPVTSVSQELDILDQDSEIQSEVDALVNAWYRDPSRFLNAEVGLTIATRRLEEEKACFLLKTVESALAKH